MIKVRGNHSYVATNSSVKQLKFDDERQLQKARPITSNISMTRLDSTSCIKDTKENKITENNLTQS